MTCWTCGEKTSSFSFTCSSCEQTKELRKIRETLGSQNLQAINEGTNIDFSDIETGLWETSFNLSEISSAINNISSILEWGLEEIRWRIDQATGVLKSIDKTLKTPGQTQAHEWRIIAEELRQRGVLKKAQEFFLRSLNANPLDYRTYISLAKTYIQLEELEKALQCLKESLPHAPLKGEIDYKSYSYRLMGRVYFCQDNYPDAVLILEKSIELSPKYYLGHYDYAQYCALVGAKEKCLSSLVTVTIRGFISIELVKKEKNFEPIRKEVAGLIEDEEFLRKLRIYKNLAKIGISTTVIEKILPIHEEFFKHWKKN